MGKGYYSKGNSWFKVSTSGGRKDIYYGGSGSKHHGHIAYDKNGRIAHIRTPGPNPTRYGGNYKGSANQPFRSATPKGTFGRAMTKLSGWGRGHGGWNYRK